MPSERVQRQIDRLLDEAEEAVRANDWQTARQRAQAALDLDPENLDAPSILAGADRALAREIGTAPATELPPTKPPTVERPASFGAGRYQVRRFLGEGGKKRVYLAHDTTLDRDVAFALIKTEGLDEAGRQRVAREAQAMGRLGNHPNVVTVYDIGQEGEQPYIVLPVLPGGDVEGLIEKAPDHKLPLDQALRIARETCQGLEFAHEKGIVHRDIKPGNVWLAEDGRAQVGDFGLAVAIDRSRLTQAGMMVGTVAYMPPEQAMGGDVGPRSDLYSLGCMLYEMVCGRPPFVGDESVAIIGQHLNTPPVAPSWHRPDCPPALEALILRLLEKDPQKRPASAKEVREALTLALSQREMGQRASPLPEGEGGRKPGEGETARNPLYRTVFVGREQEVRQLHQAFDAAMSGQGALVMVVGEPGIGKTALCEQLATYVTLRGGKTLVGHCYEEGSLSLPYLAFVEAMRSYVLAREPDGLKTDLGTGAADVARIVSEIRDRIQVELRPAGDPEDDRWRLLQSVTTFLRNASSVQPLLIVLEDLHWADRGSLDLLLHVARNLTGTRLVVIGTYRDVEVDRAHPLSPALAELRRGGAFARVPLRGLTVDEVHRMYEAVRGNEVPWGQAELVWRQTEGNPLFVQEVLRYLVEEGLVVREGGRYVVRGDPGAGVPEGLRDVVGRRLSRLSDKANQVLAIAAVIGRDFRLDVLQRVTGLADEELEAALAEAIDKAIVEERPLAGAVVVYRFSHAFFRQTLYEETIAPRRIRLHQQVARALEDVHARRLEEHASELAEHFSYSSSAEDLAKAVHYGELEARRAMRVYAYAEAVGHLEKALSVQDVLDPSTGSGQGPDDKAKRCDLLLALGEALIAAGQARRVIDETAPAALALAEALGDRPLASRVCQMAIIAVGNWGAALAWGTPEAAQWTELSDRFADDGTPARVRADIALAFHAMFSQLGTPGTLVMPENRALEVIRHADELAQRLSVPELQEEVDTAFIVASTSLDLAEERLLRAQRIKAPTYNTLFFICNVFLQHGLRDKAESVTHQLLELGARTRQPVVHLLAQTNAVWMDTADGRLEEAISTLDGLRAEADAAGHLTYFRSLVLMTLMPYYYLGRLESVEMAYRSGQTIFGGLVAATQGELEPARAALDLLTNENTAEMAPFVNVVMGMIAVLAGHEAAARLVLERLKDAPVVANGTQVGPLSIARVLGDCAALLGEREEARKHYEKAFEICDQMRLRPEKALTALGMAELLLDGNEDEQAEAQRHLDFAVSELREMKMQPWLERALKHKGLLKA